jgi:hypothetical protein
VRYETNAEEEAEQRGDAGLRAKVFAGAEFGRIESDRGYEAWCSFRCDEWIPEDDSEAGSRRDLLASLCMLTSYVREIMPETPLGSIFEQDTGVMLTSLPQFFIWAAIASVVVIRVSGPHLVTFLDSMAESVFLRWPLMWGFSINEFAWVPRAPISSELSHNGSPRFFISNPGWHRLHS